MSYLNLTNCKLFYNDTADEFPEVKNKPAILFINGWALSGRYWRPLIEELTPHFRCVTFDQSGTGETKLTTKKHDFTMAGLAAQAGELIENLELGKHAPLHLVGHSMGSMVTAEIYHENKEKISSVMINGCGIFEFSRVAMDIMTVFVKGTMSLKFLFNLDVFKKAFVMKATAAPIPKAYEKILVDDFINTDAEACETIGTFSLNRDILEKYEEQLMTINVPVLLCVGDKDKTIPPEGMTTLFEHRKKRSISPTEFVRFTKLGHLPMLENTKSYASILSSHLNRATKHESKTELVMV